MLKEKWRMARRVVGICFQACEKLRPAQSVKIESSHRRKSLIWQNIMNDEIFLQNWHSFFEEFLGALEVFGGVNTHRFDVGKTHADAISVLQPA